MRLSALQRFILISLEKQGGSAKIRECYGYYPPELRQRDLRAVQSRVDKSLGNLVDKDLLTAYGRRTAKKFFIEKVRLTRAGRRVVREQLKARQGILPLLIRR